MDPQIYEVLSLAMRYFFVLIGVMIVWRSFSWLRKDRKQKHRRLKQLPDAGTIGILTVEQGGRHLQEGAILPVPHEGVLGYLRTCDVVVPVEDVVNLHLDFTFADGKGLYIYPRRGCEARVDGMPLTCRRDSLAHPMLHGSTLEIGQAVLRLGVFAGLNVPEVQPVVLPEMPPLPEDGWFPELDWQPVPPDMMQNVPPMQNAPPMQPPYAPPVQPPSPPLNPPYGNPWQGGDYGED